MAFSQECLQLWQAAGVVSARIIHADVFIDKRGRARVPLRPNPS